MKSRQVKHDGEEGKTVGERDIEREIWGEGESNRVVRESGMG